MKDKTNVMRILDRAKINYQIHSYVDTDAISGIDVAAILNQDPKQVFKTLVTIGKSNQYYVFLIPVNEELDLKKAASSVNEKSISMLKSKDLLSITGYIHGGCSPIGMKKLFNTTLHYSIRDFNRIILSAGKVGYQIEMTTEDLKKVIKFQVADIIV